ncbi:MAG TPA: methyltransferase domain-containing protein [Sphingomonas sp.]|nr:methyltransferase domain-containing protein [Sphingomonas sp.]
MRYACDRRTFLLGTAWTMAVPHLARASGQDLSAPYVPTSPEVVEAMLDLAELKPGERLVDLGSGDGRIAIAAARRGAEALGVELDPRLVRRARTLAEMAGEGRARFLRADLFTVSLRDADVVTLYLLPDVNERLKPKLLHELRPGARVVSHAFDMGDWEPDTLRSVAGRRIFRWTVPAVAGGTWRLRGPSGAGALLVIEQRYNRVTGTLDGEAITEARLTGASLSFVAGGARYRGIVGERSIRGDGVEVTWDADRAD